MTQAAPIGFDVICIGSVLWDVVGRSEATIRPGDDRPGRIRRLPGGVAMNIAVTLARMGLRPAVLSAVGQDAQGDALIAECARLGCDARHVYRSDTLPTDLYMAIEDPSGLIAAIADAHSLEAAGARILDPLRNGPLGHAEAPYAGLVALDGNLTAALLAEIAVDPAFAAADLRVAPASPGKAERLRSFVTAGRGTLYVNLAEAGLLCGAQFATSAEAAAALRAAGAARVIVTDGAQACTDADGNGVFTGQPPKVRLARVTGAGDTFMAAHMVAERHGAGRQAALQAALAVAADYVSTQEAP